MCLLGRSETSSETEENGISGSKIGSLESNLRNLLGVQASVHERRQQLTKGLQGNDDGVSKDPSNASGILYAARGGRTTFELARRQITTNGDLPSKLPVSTMLGLVPESPSYNGRRQQLLEKLLGQAALGGDTSVLRNLSSAVRAQTAVLARYESFYAKDACQRGTVWTRSTLPIFFSGNADVQVFPLACTGTLSGSPSHRACITGEHSKKDELLAAKIAKYKVFCVYHRSYLISPPPPT